MKFRTDVVVGLCHFTIVNKKYSAHIKISSLTSPITVQLLTSKLWNVERGIIWWMRSEFTLPQPAGVPNTEKTVLPLFLCDNVYKN